MMIDENDINKLKQARQLIMEVIPKIDCHYCQSHLEYIINLLDDAIDISKFNILYADDAEALQNLRKILTEESTLRLLAIASKIVGFFRKIKMDIKVRKKFIN
ncbi:MAG: hypothetical protein QXN11_05790 [Thermoplasmata archaeon]